MNNTVSFLDLSVDSFTQLVGNRIFTISSYTKSGTLRTYNALLGVNKYVKGTKPEATAKREATLRERNMVTVYDLGVEGYRTVSLDSVVELKVNGNIYTA